MKTATISAIRFGYGLGPRPQPIGRDAVFGSLMLDDHVRRTHPGLGLEQALAYLREENETRRAGDRPGAQAANKRIREKINAAQPKIERSVFARILDGPSPFRERLTMFWLDHFSTAPKTLAGRILSGSLKDEVIRPRLAGSFVQLLRGAVLHPQMLLYLDQSDSIGPTSPAGLKRGRGLNENLAREILELHTLGASGHYDQTDVRQFAELLTGVSFRVQDGVSFRPNAAEPGRKRYLGTPYGGGRARLSDIHAALDDLAVHPDTARHIATKLVVHFVTDDPDPDHVAQIERAWLGSGGDLMEVYAALLDHPAAWSSVFGKARQPFDFMAASLLALGMTGSEVMALDRKLWNAGVRQTLKMLGQPFMRPPAPDGWPEEAEAWITPSGLATKIRWAMSVPEQLRGALSDSRAFVKTALDDAASERLIWAVGASETVTQGIGLVLASPDFNRR